MDVPEHPGGVQAREAMDVTVRLFSTRPVWKVQITTEGGGKPWCVGCPPADVPTSLSASPAGELMVNGRSVRAPLVFAGAARVAAEDRRTAAVAGRWRVVGRADGLHVTVEIPSERYVMAVLAAEAAPDEPAESLKALAVVARSFAMQNPRRHGLEGLCDSTHCQALRLAPVREAVQRAVEATSGETLWFDVRGEPLGLEAQGGRRAGPGGGVRQVSGYFTENCGGVSEDAAVLWGGAREPWLSTHPDPYCARSPGLWHAEFAPGQVGSALAAEGLAVPAGILRVDVVKRDASGRAARLALRGAGVNAKPAEVSAADLRFALNRAYGWNGLRGDLYRVSMVNGRVVFDGRGYGHGVGLCQVGARAMAVQGKGYREILEFYFSGTSVRVLAGDGGWTSQQEQGWGLRAIRGGEASADVEASGNKAWAAARAAWPIARGAAAQAPEVTLYPTTELFRQAAGAPGWELAATHGSAVALQPLAIVRRAAAKGSSGVLQGDAVEAVLRHEFLHVLVEGEAAPIAPLWLREGLVEVLDDRCRTARSDRRQAMGGRQRDPATTLKPDEVEASLRAADNWAKSQQGHADACALVRRDVQQYGVAMVREWLREGVPAQVLTRQ